MTQHLRLASADEPERFGGQFPSTFDPELVPHFPKLVIEVSRIAAAPKAPHNPFQVKLDGITVPMDPTEQLGDEPDDPASPTEPTVKSAADLAVNVIDDASTPAGDDEIGLEPLKPATGEPTYDKPQADARMSGMFRLRVKRATAQHPGDEEPTPLEARWLQRTMQAGMAAAAARIAQHGWEACRVNAIDLDAHTWQLIIGPEGQIYDLDAAAEEAQTQRRKQRRHRRLPFLIAGIVVAVCLVVGAGVTLLRYQRYAEAAAARASATASPAPPKPAPAEYPAAPPAGSSTHAQWRFGPIAAGDNNATTGPGGGIWARTGKALVRIDPYLGTQTWTTKIDSSSTGPWIRPASNANHSTTDIVVTLANQTLTWRSLTDLAPHQAELDQADKVLPLAGAIAIEKADQHAAILTTRGLVNRLIPAASTIVGVDGTTLHTTAGTRLWNINEDQPQTPAPVTLQPPFTGTMPQTGTSVWKDGHLASIWTNTDGQNWLTLHDAAGKLINSTKIQNTSTPDSLNTPRWTVYGNYLVDQQKATVTTLPANWRTTTAITGNLVYGTNDAGTSTRYDITTKRVVTADTTLGQAPGDDQVIGTAGNDPIITARLTNGIYLYRLNPH